MNSLYLVAGLGKTGLSVARYLHRNNKAFMVFDTRPQSAHFVEFKTEFPDVPVYFEEFPEHLIPELTDLILSPGLSLEDAHFQKIKHAPIAVYGDIECLVREISAPVVAITGTNGKSTVTTLVGEMAKAAGFKVAIAGNIGIPVLDLLHDDNQYDLWVLELSSFQLELTHSLAPQVATILNITPDHLDRHHTLEAYIQAKQRIYHRAKLALFNREDEATAPEQDVQCLSFGQESADFPNWGLINQNNQIYLAKGQAGIMPVDTMLIKGVHNWMNALAACALADAVGVPTQAICDVLKTFPGLAHRCQWVRLLDEVNWINDSKGTNMGATISAIRGIGGAMQGKIVLIAGGQGKGADFSEMRPTIAEFVRSIVLIGEDADLMDSALAPATSITRAETLEQAVILAKAEAKPGDVVLLSPACASLDMFRDFNHRGDMFVASVNGL